MRAACLIAVLAFFLLLSTGAHAAEEDDMLLGGEAEEEMEVFGDDVNNSDTEFLQEEAGDEDEDATIDDEDESSSDNEEEKDGDETQQLLEMAEGCSERENRKTSRCSKLRSLHAKDSKYCLRHPNSRSVRCHRLDALERLLYRRSGPGRVARDLMRQCRGRRLTKGEKRRLRKVLQRRYVSTTEEKKLLSILAKCKLTSTQMLQLSRIIRIDDRRRNDRRLTARTKTLKSELARLEKEERDIPKRRWLYRLQRLVGDADDVKDEWMKKIIEAAKDFDPCADVECPADSECSFGKCYKVDLCKKNNVTCSEGFECKNGECQVKTCKGVSCASGLRCYRGDCIPRTSCDGITCVSGTRCVEGKCVDLTTMLVTCHTLKCGEGETCVDEALGATCVKRVKAARPAVHSDKKKAHVEAKPPSWNVGKWSDCSKPCGQPGGYRTRLVMCKYLDGKVAADAQCAASAEKPMDSTDCECNKRAPVFHAEPETAAEVASNEAMHKEMEAESAPVTSSSSDDDSSSGSSSSGSSSEGQCPKRCEGTTRVRSCKGRSCTSVAQPCGRPACTVPDFRTIMRVCRGGSWTHCNCPKGYYPISGGCDGTTWPHRWQYNNWNGANGWLCGGHKGKKTVHVLCARGMGACRWQTSDGSDWHRQLCPTGTEVVSGGCNAIGKPHLLRWQMKSGNGWLCGGWNGKKRTSVLCCDSQSMRSGCKTFSRKFGDWGHVTCPKNTKLVSGGCDSDKPYLIRSSRPINRRTWQCGGWGGNKTITVTCCPDEDDY